MLQWAGYSFHMYTDTYRDAQYTVYAYSKVLFLEPNEMTYGAS